VQIIAYNEKLLKNGAQMENAPLNVSGSEGSFLSEN